MERSGREVEEKWQKSGREGKRNGNEEEDRDGKEGSKEKSLRN